MTDVDLGMFGFEWMPQTVRVTDELLDGMVAINVSANGNQDESTYMMLSAGTGTDAIGHNSASAIVSSDPLVATLDNIANDMDYQSNNSAEKRRISPSKGCFVPDVDPDMLGFKGMPQH